MLRAIACMDVLANVNAEAELQYYGGLRQRGLKGVAAGTRLSKFGVVRLKSEVAIQVSKSKTCGGAQEMDDAPSAAIA